MKKRFFVTLLLVLCLMLPVGLVSCGDNGNENGGSGGGSKAYYTVTFDSDGGSAVASQSVENNKKATEPTVPTKDGYGFDGWYLGEEKWSFVGYSVTENITLKAKWMDIFNLSGNEITGLTKYGKTLQNIVIPQYMNNVEITSIGRDVFAGCSSLTSITLPSSVRSIGRDAFNYFCSSLTDVYYNGTISDWCNITFSGGSNANPMSYAKHFYIKNRNSEYEELTEINLPSDITEIKYCTFYGFNNVTKVSIPSSVTSIDSGAFSNCSSLTDVYYGGTISDWCKITFSGGDSNPMYYDLYNNRNNKHFYIKNSNLEYEELTEIEIPSDITEIKDYTFCGFNNVTKVSIPSSVTSIGRSAFSNCSSLTSVIFGENSQLTRIGEYAFYNCSSLTSIVIPSSVTSIGEYAFYNCSSLEKVYYAGTSSQWSNISIGLNNSKLTSATRYYYSATQPTESGNYWHYDTDGKTVVEW